MTDANRERMTADEAHALAVWTGKVIDNCNEALKIFPPASSVYLLIVIVEKQQRLLDYALAEIGRLRAANDARTGGK